MEKDLFTFNLVHIFKGNLWMEKLIVVTDCQSYQMALIIEDSLEDLYLMEKEHLILLLELLIQVIGQKVFLMGKVKSIFLMETVIREVFKME